MPEPFNPFVPGQAQSAWPLLAELRRRGPVAEIAGGMRYVTRHAECRAALRDTTSLSNASGMKEPGVVVPPEDRLLGELDPPLHTAVRRVMVTALSPKLVHAAEPFIAETAGALLDALPSDGADLVADFTVPLPNRVTMHLLGFDPADADRVGGYAKELMESPFPATNRSERGVGFAAAFPEFAGYVDEQIERRASELAAGTAVDDVLARLLRLDVDGEPLPRQQVRALVRNLITGGLTTTSQLLGNLLHVLVSDRAVEDAVRAGEEHLVNAIEESLRLSPPILFLARGCVHEVTIGDTTIEPGTRVIIGAGSANRDERVFADADEFHADRSNADQHLTFGYGPHVCPGAALARTVALVGLRTFFGRFPPGTVRLEPGFEFENVPTFFEVGPRRLPVKIVTG
jgi:cytochrome P450